MKRSEILKFISDRIVVASAFINDVDDLAEIILDEVERQGMLPPKHKTHHADGGVCWYNDHNEWEPEDD